MLEGARRGGATVLSHITRETIFYFIKFYFIISSACKSSPNLPLTGDTGNLFPKAAVVVSASSSPCAAPLSKLGLRRFLYRQEVIRVTPHSHGSAVCSQFNRVSL